MTRVKICGLSTEETMAAALDAGADMVGLVLVPASPRAVSPERAGALAAQARGRAQIVALLVDPEEEALDAAVAAFAPDLIQLHGQETAARVATIRARLQRPVIKAVGVAAQADLAQIAAFAPVCDHILLDAKPPAGAAYPGGHGQAFDWSILRGAALPPGLILSGGLTPETVGDAIAQVRPWAVDVSSGVERARGVKDPALIHSFIGAARDAEARLSADAAHGSGRA